MLTEQEYNRRVAYCRVAVLRMGVPYAFWEDAVQDIMIKAWKDGTFNGTLVQYGAIDAARKYGERTRTGYSRTHDEIPLSYQVNPWPAVERVLDYEEAIRSLTPTQRRNLFNHFTGKTTGEASDTKAYQARVRLRKRIAA